MTAPRVAIYCRVSDPGAAEKYGMDTQEGECRAYAAERGWAVSHVYREFASGADLFERPQMTTLRAAMRRRDFDILLVHRLDRLSRDINHQGYLLSEAEHAGVSWVSATEAIDDSPMGVILRAVIGAFAEMDRLKITANTARGRRAKAEGGRPLGQGKPRYGLMWSDDKTRCIEDLATVGHLRRIFADYDRGMSLRALGIALEADGILPPYHTRTGSTAWSAGTLRTILTDATYIGKGEAFRTISERVRTPDGRKVRRHRPRAAEDRIVLPSGVFPVVIDPAQFGRVQARLEANRRESQRRDRDPQFAILRRGYAFCGGCGHPLTVLTRKDAPTVYHCHSDSRRMWGCPYGSIAIMVDELDIAIWDWLTTELADEDRVRWHLEQLRDDPADGGDLDGIDRHLAAIGKQQASLAQAVAMLDSNPEGMAPLVAQLDALGKQRRAAERDRADVLARQEQRLAHEAELVDIAAHCGKIAATMAGIEDYADRRHMIDLLKVKVTLHPASHRPRWTATSVIAPQGVNSDNLFSTSQSTEHLVSVVIRWTSEDTLEVAAD